MSAALGFGSASFGCAKPASDTNDPHLEGRYAVTSSPGTSRYMNLWFSKTGSYEAVLAQCTSDCIETGRYVYASGELTLSSAKGTTSTFALSRSPGASASTMGLRVRDVGSDGEVGADGIPADDDPCSEANATTSSLHPTDEGEGNAIVASGLSCLLPGVLQAFALDDGSTARLEGTLSPSERIAQDDSPAQLGGPGHPFDGTQLASAHGGDFGRQAVYDLVSRREAREAGDARDLLDPSLTTAQLVDALGWLEAHAPPAWGFSAMNTGHHYDPSAHSGGFAIDFFALDPKDDARFVDLVNADPYFVEIGLGGDYQALQSRITSSDKCTFVDSNQTHVHAAVKRAFC